MRRNSSDPFHRRPNGFAVAGHGHGCVVKNSRIFLNRTQKDLKENNDMKKSHMG